MADVDPRLVEAIAAQVMAALAGIRAAGGGAAGGGPSAPVQVHAPIGTCTGDYSKFPELRGMQGAPSPAWAQQAGPAGQAVVQYPPVAPRPIDGTSVLPPANGGGIPQPSRGELYPQHLVPTGPDGTSTLPPTSGGPVAPDRHHAYAIQTGPAMGSPDGSAALPPAEGRVQPSHAPITGQARASGMGPDGVAVLPPAGGGGGVTAPQVTSLKGVITVANLRNIRGAVRLAKGAILTPLAQDYIRDRNITVMSDEMAPAVKVNGGGAPLAGGGAPILWWIEGQCPSVAKLVEALRQNLLASRERGNADNLKSVVKELAGLVKNKKVAGGVLFVPSAARAICYANRCQSLRAVVATNDRAVSEGIELLGANVLVVEYSQFGFKAMHALVKPFIESMQTVPAPVQRELDELRTCG
jgi:hypothetical protein